MFLGSSSLRSLRALRETKNQLTQSSQRTQSKKHTLSVAEFCHQNKRLLLCDLCELCVKQKTGSCSARNNAKEETHTFRGGVPSSEYETSSLRPLRALRETKNQLSHRTQGRKYLFSGARFCRQNKRLLLCDLCELCVKQKHLMQGPPGGDFGAHHF